jgi:hypothetical protein
LPLAALVFLGAFIPVIAATLSGTVAVLVAVVTHGPVSALIVLAIVIGVQQLGGHVPVLAVANTAIRYLVEHPRGEPAPRHDPPGTTPTDTKQTSTIPSRKRSSAATPTTPRP